MSIKTNYKNAIIHILLVFAGIGQISPIHAQGRDWKSVDWQLGVGSTYLYDEYLSPLSHDGYALRFSNGSLRPLKWGQSGNQSDNFTDSFYKADWYNQLRLSASAAQGESVAGASLLYVNLDIRNSVFRKIISEPRWSLLAGAYTSISGGGRYCYQNGNNPGSADALIDLGATTIADYNFPFLGKSMKLRYQGSLALGGLAFSPEYAESYYEIFYLNNHHNIIKLTSPFNKQDWKQQISLDIPLSGLRSSFRLSYLNEGRICLLNDIRIRELSNYFSIGYIHYFRIL